MRTARGGPATRELPADRVLHLPQLARRHRRVDSRTRPIDIAQGAGSTRVASEAESGEGASPRDAWSRSMNQGGARWRPQSRQHASTSSSSAASGSAPPTARRSRTAIRSRARWSRTCRRRRGDARRAIEAAAAAFPAWSADAAGRAAARLPQGGRRPREPSGRGRLAARARDGCTFGFGDVPDALRPGALPAGGGARVRADRRGDPVGHPGTFAMGLRRPVGVVGAIAPWNAALILSARSIAAPLALGNTVVLKPSEWSPVVRRPALGRDLRRGRAARRAC